MIDVDKQGAGLPAWRTMLEHTFIHLPSIGPATELNLWREGILTWDDLESRLQSWPVSTARRRHLAAGLRASRQNRSRALYFHERLPSAERWRLYRDFRHRCAFLDIETTGISNDLHEITVIGVYDGEQMHQFISGENLEEFEEVIGSFDLLVTFNGSRFDLPFIVRHFRNFRFRQAHIDLLYVLRRLGFRGGLKSIEPLLGIYRPPETLGMSGFEAVFLWQQHLHGDSGALSRLLLYNRADVVNLQTIMELAWDRLYRNLELATCRPLTHS
jgi:uncharacterized protein YprB with RNaseH-like and TPR domain